MTCVIYTRFSPRPDADDSRSCAWQRAECSEYARKRAWTVRTAFDDPDRSGADACRETLWDAISALRKGDTLLVWKWDRLARDLMLSLQIERAVQKRGATVTAVEGDVPGNDPHAEFTRHILAAVGELERRMISQRTSTAMRRHQRDGHRMSARVPYGWMVDPSDAGRIVPNPAEEPVVEEIWSRYRKGESYNYIARALDPSASRVGRWHSAVVRNIVLRLARDRA